MNHTGNVPSEVLFCKSKVIKRSSNRSGRASNCASPSRSCPRSSRVISASISAESAEFWSGSFFISDGADSTQRAARRRALASPFCFFQARFPEAHLLTAPSFRVRKVYVNSEPQRNNQNFTDFRDALGESRKKIKTEVHVALTTTSTKDFDRGEIKIEVLAPVPEIAGSGSGGRDLQGRLMNSNTMSAVIRIVRGGIGEVLFTGDMDNIGLDNLLNECPEPQAHVLVFPHHGGLPGRGDAYEFALKFCEVLNVITIILYIGIGTE